MGTDLNSDTCQWFALCPRPATTTRSGHLFTGVGQAEVFDIPVCDQCAEFVDYLEAKDA